MKYISMVCPNCGANLENIDSELKQCYWQSCGTKIAIDDGTKVTKNYNYDEADIIRAQTEQQIKLQEMEEQKKKNLFFWKVIAGVAIFALVMLLVGYIYGRVTGITLDSDDELNGFYYIGIMCILGNIFAIICHSNNK